MIQSQLSYEEKIHGDHPRAAVIWLHGLGADGFDFLPIVEQLSLPSDLSIRFIFPHAPIQAVTLNQGMQMRSWYDIYALDINSREDKEGIFNAMHAVENLIADACSDISPSHIVLVGFSQGGGVALQTLVHSKLALAGVIALSTYLPLRNEIDQAVNSNLSQTPVFMSHGSFDEVLSHDFGKMSKDLLINAGANVKWQSYPMAHSLCPEQISDISQWLIERLRQAQINL